MTTEFFHRHDNTCIKFYQCLQSICLKTLIITVHQKGFNRAGKCLLTTNRNLEFRQEDEQWGFFMSFFAHTF